VVEIDDGHASLRFQRCLDPREVVGALLQMVIGVAEEDEVHAVAWEEGFLLKSGSRRRVTLTCSRSAKRKQVALRSARVPRSTTRSCLVFAVSGS